MTAVHEIRQKLHARRLRHVSTLRQEASRLAEAAADLGAERVVLFGSLVSGNPGLASDVDLLIVWDTPLGTLERIAELYRRLAPQAPVDLLVYTPQEMETMADRPFVRRALAEGKVLYAA